MTPSTGKSWKESRTKPAMEMLKQPHSRWRGWPCPLPQHTKRIRPVRMQNHWKKVKSETPPKRKLHGKDFKITHGEKLQNKDGDPSFNPTIPPQKMKRRTGSHLSFLTLHLRGPPIKTPRKETRNNTQTQKRKKTTTWKVTGTAHLTHPPRNPSDSQIHQHPHKDQKKTLGEHPPHQKNS